MSAGPKEKSVPVIRRKFISRLILFLSSVAWLSIAAITAMQLGTGGICPPVWGVPACFLLILTISLMLVAQLKFFGYGNLLFFAAAAATWMIAVYLSYREIGDQTVCPTEPVFEIPMCFVSFLLFGGLMILKTLEIRMGH